MFNTVTQTLQFFPYFSRIVFTAFLVAAVTIGGLIIASLIIARFLGSSSPSSSSKDDNFWKALSLLTAYTLQFFSDWIIFGCVTWLLILGLIYTYSGWIKSLSLWYFGIPYFLLLLTLPISSLICLKTWGGIIKMEGEKKLFLFLIQAKKIYLSIQIFFSILSFFSFLALGIFISLFAAEELSYSLANFLKIILIPLVPTAISLISAGIYSIKFLLLRKQLLGSQQL